MSDPTAWIGTSWKMHKTLAEAKAFAEAIAATDAARDARIQRFVIPPFTAVRQVKEILAATSVKVGAQNMHWADQGAWTGEISPLMLKGGGGRIVSMSSLNAHTGGVTSAVSKFAYAAAKAGILGMTRALAKELGPTIAVNAVCPGVIQTELGNSLTRSRGAELAKKIALERVGTPADVARLVAFLCAEEPNFITGQHFIVDGFQWEI